jgi:hypothetical protein
MGIAFLLDPQVHIPQVGDEAISVFDPGWLLEAFCLTGEEDELVHDSSKKYLVLRDPRIELVVCLLDPLSLLEALAREAAGEHRHRSVNC